jgi:hypothetical protein
MKSILIVIACITISFSVSAQLVSSAPVCPTFRADILDGNINKVHPKSTLGEVVKTFPCYTTKVDKDSMECTRVIYADKGVTFFPARNYIEIRDNFKGTMEPALLGKSRGSLFTTLGNPKMKDANWDAYQTQYGTLVVYYNKAGKINKLQMSSRGTDTMKLCE